MASMPRWRPARMFRPRSDRRQARFARSRRRSIRTIGRVFRYSGPGNCGKFVSSEGRMIEDLNRPKLSRLQGGEPGILHVMFHGAFVFDFHDDHVDVLIPEVEGHVYRAGNWLGETELICGEQSDGHSHEHGGEVGHDSDQDSREHTDLNQPETYHLEGVDRGRVTTLPPDHNLMLSAPLKKDVDRLLHARIDVPLPLEIKT